MVVIIHDKKYKCNKTDTKRSINDKRSVYSRRNETKNAGNTAGNRRWTAKKWRKPPGWTCAGSVAAIEIMEITKREAERKNDGGGKNLLSMREKSGMIYAAAKPPFPRLNKQANKKAARRRLCQSPRISQSGSLNRNDCPWRLYHPNSPRQGGFLSLFQSTSVTLKIYRLIFHLFV